MRADKFFADKFGSRTKAAQELDAGRILRNGKALLPKDDVCAEDEFTFLQPNCRFVSAGGYKLAKAIAEFSYDCKGKVFADVGASTGGFTDCLLQNGAAKVFAVDVGESLLHESLRNDPRVIAMENVNARYLDKDAFSMPLDAIVADVSFISLKHIFPVISALLDEGKDAFVLIKPQFECDRSGIGKSGIVKKTEHKKILKKVFDYAFSANLLPIDLTNAPVKKGKNIEYVLHLKRENCEVEPLFDRRKAIENKLLLAAENALKSIGEND